jgi:dihydroorotate dehydrogenase (fumarate)
MVNLDTTYGGISVKNPFISAAGPNTGIPEACEKNAEAGWAAVVLKTCYLDLPEWASCKVGTPVLRLYDSAGRNTWKPIPPKKSTPKVQGRKGIKAPPYATAYILHTDPGFYKDEQYIWYYNESKRLCDPHDCKVIPSITAVTDEGWDKLCRMVNKMKPQAVELNLSVPRSDPPSGKLAAGLRPGMVPASQPEVAERITKFCVDHIDVPAIVKLAPLIPQNADIALVIQQAGAKGINLGNRVGWDCLRINIDTATPGGHPDFPTWSECSWGPWVIPYNCGAIYHMRSVGVTIDISGCGGIFQIEDAIRYIMAGASTVQACAAVMVEGFDVVGPWLQDLNPWMQRNGYDTINRMTGVVIGRLLKDRSKLPLRTPRKIGGPPAPLEVVVDQRKCIDCGWCEKCCMYSAIQIVEMLPQIDRAKCEVCGLCQAVCPVGALSLQNPES